MGANPNAPARWLFLLTNAVQCTTHRSVLQHTMQCAAITHAACCIIHKYLLMLSVC